MGISVTPSVSSGKAPLRVTFSVTSTLNERDRLWSFGDGQSGTDWLPTHYYQNPGTYSGTLTVNYNDTCCPFTLISDTVTFTVTVTKRISCYSLDKCYWVGDGTMDQGVGVSEFTGDYFPQAASYISAKVCRDTLDNERTILFDNKTGTFKEVFKIDGATGSGLSKIWTDDDALGVAHEISGYIDFPEYATQVNNEYIEFMEGYYSTIPCDESKKSATGYDSAGYRSAQEFDVSIFVDGAQTATNTNNDAIINGEVSYDYQVKGKRGRTRFSFAASEFYLTKYTENWLITDTKDAPSYTVTTEMILQSNLSSPALWFTRGTNLIMNRVTGSNISVVVPKTIEGKDGLSNSGYGINSSLNFGAIAATGTITFWGNSYLHVGIKIGASVIELLTTTVDTAVVGGVTWYSKVCTYSAASAGELIFFVASGAGKLFDPKYNGVTVTATATASTGSTTGPDSNADSALTLLSGNPISPASVALTGTLLLWYNGGFTVTIDGNSVSLTSAGTKIVGGVTWTLGYAVYTVASAGSLVIAPTSIATVKLFDIRQYSSALSSEITYLYNDMVNNNGDRTIPTF